MTRSFDAPRALVFKAMTDPTLIPKWWGPAGLATTVDKMDPKPGGTWRFVHGDDGASENAFHGVYHAVIAPERLIYTFEWEGLPGHAMLETITLEEHDGKTTMQDIAVFPTTEERDGMIASGMEGGANETMDRLAELVRSMA
jgi:uncharacterized protein YndB with AHSA1/START domain